MVQLQKKETDADVKPSLIPIVSKEENCLGEMVNEARLQGERLVAQARQKADQRIEASKREFPDLARRARERGIKDVDTEAAGKRDVCQRELAALEQTAAKNMEATVAHIVALTLPQVRL